MGYACPVCGTPEADERHLADHMAVTAMTHGDDHEDWLDEHVPDWVERGPADLGPVVAEAAAEADYPQVFEDTTGGRGDATGGHRHDHHDHRDDRGETLEDHLAAAGRRGPGSAGRGDLTAGRDAPPVDESVLSEARRMTRRMLGEDAPDAEGDADADGSDGSDRDGDGNGAAGDE